MTKVTDKPGLRLVTNNEHILKPSASVSIDGQAERFDEFVVFGVNDMGLVLYQNADTLTLGLSLIMLNAAFEAAKEQETPENLEMVMSVLRGE